MPRGGRRGRLWPNPRYIRDSEHQNHHSSPPRNARWSVQMPLRWRRRPSRNWYFERSSPDGPGSSQWIGYNDNQQSGEYQQNYSDVCDICGDVFRNHVDRPNIHLCNDDMRFYNAEDADDAGDQDFSRMEGAAGNDDWDGEMVFRTPPRSDNNNYSCQDYRSQHQREMSEIGRDAWTGRSGVGDLHSRFHVARELLATTKKEVEDLCTQLNDLCSNIKDVPVDQEEKDSEEVTESMVSEFEKSLDNHYRAFLNRIKQQVRDKHTSLVRESQKVKHEKESIQSSIEEVSIRKCDLEHHEKELQEMRRHVDAERTKMMKENDEERKEIRRQWQKLQDEMNRMENMNKLQQGRVKLDVGGHVFTTSVSTLTRDSESMLSAMFSGRYKLNHEKDGSVFIDRDGTHFRYILNFLRDGATEGSLPEDRQTLKELLNEAIYYQVTGLIEAIEEKLDQ